MGVKILEGLRRSLLPTNLRRSPSTFGSGGRG